MINFKLENYSKKTPTHWKAIGDTALYSIPIIDALVALIPIIPAKEWIVLGWTFVAAIIKIATKYISEVEKDGTVTG
jgi:hypothetical protein